MLTGEIASSREIDSNNLQLVGFHTQSMQLAVVSRVGRIKMKVAAFTPLLFNLLNHVQGNINFVLSFCPGFNFLNEHTSNHGRDIGNTVLRRDLPGQR